MNPPDLATWLAFTSFASKVFGTNSSFQLQFFPQVLYEYDGSNNLIYVGLAPRGALTSDAIWIIWNLTYTSGNLTSQKSSIPKVKWDDRATTVTYA
jgi:hypothetical protein